jgi:hypothetical protein
MSGSPTMIRPAHARVTATLNRFGEPRNPRLKRLSERSWSRLERTVEMMMTLDSRGEAPSVQEYRRPPQALSTGEPLF